MACERFEWDVRDAADERLDPERQARLQAHLDECPACAALLADLRAIKSAAGRLPAVAPGSHVWTALQAKVSALPPLREESGAEPAVTPSRVWRQPTAWRPWLAAAAALLVATSVGVSYVWQTRPAATPSPAVASAEGAPADLATSVEADLEAAEMHYQRAIQGLEQIATADDEALDPPVAATLQKNLHVIESAIAESRAAVRAQPASVDARESLFGAMREKVALLQQTVELINEMRKGNQAEAGRIMQGLSQP